MWKTEIRSMKNALQVVIGTEALPKQVLLTLLNEVEGILNAKPLGYVTSDIADPDPVTLSMLLMGWRDVSLPQVTYAPTSVTKKRCQHSQLMADHFWAQFIRNYLPTLQVQQKWQQPAENLTLDSVVLIVDPQLPRSSWSVGKVVKVDTSPDGCIGSAEVDVNGQTYRHPVARLVPLPAIPDD